MESDRYILKLINGESLTRKDAESLMNCLVSSETSDIRRAAFLTGLHFKGATTEEIIGFSESLRSHSIASRIPGLTDIVGTGGDGKNTINVSTGASIASSALGIKIAKHGNVGITSRHGSADFMKYIGYNFERGVSDPEGALNQNSFLYVFAPRFNNSFASFADVRKKIGHRTIFNIMGPITNPFDPDRLVIGTADEKTSESYAQVLKVRGKRGYVFHSADGLDEISPSAETAGFLISGGVRSVTIVPEDITGRGIDLKNVTTQDPEECFTKTLKGLLGRDRDASSFIALNAAPALVLNGVAGSIEDGYQAAMNAIGEGTVEKQIRKLAAGEAELNEAS